MPPPIPSIESEPRSRCDRCRKPAQLCLCARTLTVANRTHVLVLQHPRERFHAVGTARIVRLGLAATDMMEVIGKVQEPSLMSGATLLYPGPESRDLGALGPDERPDQLVVLDGTWRQARRMFLDNPWLQELPRVQLTPLEPSRYRIRRQPAAHCVSTLESIVCALRVLEPETLGLEGLLEVFDSMIEEQQAFMTGPMRTPRFKRRLNKPPRAIPAVLRENPECLLLVYGETTPGDPNVDGGRRRLVRWSAIRPIDADVFDCIVRPSGSLPAPEHLAHMGLEPADVSGAVSLREAGQAWSHFRRDNDLVVAWHPAMLRILTWLDADAPTGFALRTIWSNSRRKRPGGLDSLVRRLELAVQGPPIPGRACARLGQALAAMHHLL